MATTNLHARLVLALMCVLSLAGCSVLRHRHCETVTLSTLQTKKESHEAIRLSDSLARTFCFSADSLDLRLCDSSLLLHATHVRFGQKSHSQRHYGQVKQTCDTVARLQHRQQNDECHAEAGLIATPSTQKGHPLPWILSGTVITLGLCLLLWLRLRKQ